MESKSLWPEDLFEQKLVAPVLILREQAKYLSIKSGRTILGDVSTQRASSAYGSYGSVSDESTDVVHTFQLQVPGLGDYTFDLFQIRHQPRALYPVFLDSHLEEDRSDIKLEDEKSFRDAVRGILSSPETVSVIRTLMAQVEDPDTLPPSVKTSSRAQGNEADDDDIPF